MHYHDYAVRETMPETVYSCVDIVSLNEEELKYTLKEMYDFDGHRGYHLCVEGARFIAGNSASKESSSIQRIIPCRRSLKADIERTHLWNLLATAKAQNGWYGTKEQILEVLGFELSPKGRREPRRR